MNNGVISMGIQCPIIKKGDDLRSIVVNSVLNAASLEDNDVIGITESVVARAQGNYVTVDDVAKETIRLFGKHSTIMVMYPIYSRNRFSIILKGIARGCDNIILKGYNVDEVGNPFGVNHWTGIDIKQYYKDIVESENCNFFIYGINSGFSKVIQEWDKNRKYLICSLHNSDKVAKIYYKYKVATLQNYFSNKCNWGLLGSNKANEETLKLFPNGTKSLELVYDIQKDIYNKTGKKIQVMIYGDGCFKDPDTGIWEFADPVAAVAYTDGLEGHPNEIKLKAFADDKYNNLSGVELEKAIKHEIANKDKELIGKMDSQGTTPRRYVNLLASLMDLTSGSGDKGTPIVLVKNYFKNYSNA